MHRCRIRMNQSPRRDDSNGCLIVKMRGSHLRRKGMCPMRSEGGISAEEQPDRQPPVATSSRISGISGSGSGHVTVESVTVLELPSISISDSVCGKLGRETKKQSKTIIEDD